MKQKKPAFTLIEILIVVGIIVVLLAMSTQMMGSASDAQGKDRAKADIAVLSTAIEEFKAIYGSYPRLSCAVSEKASAAKLYRCLTGKMYMAVEDGSVVFKDLSSNSYRKPLIDVSKMNLGSTVEDEFIDPEDNKTFFADPWGEPYVYVYDTSSSTGKSSSWTSPSFILLSKGPDMKAHSSGSMYSDGDLGDMSSYKTKGDNQDNIIKGID